MSSKHTPGPWSWYTHNDHRVAIDGPGGAEVARAEEYGASAWIEVSEDDARLIAAAPELLEALTKKVQDAEQRMFEDWLEFNSPSGDHEAVQRQWLESNDYRGFIGEWREQLDAISKATGGAQ